MVSKGILRSLYKRYGFVILVMMIISSFVVLSDETFTYKRITFTQDEIQKVKEVYKGELANIYHDKNNYDEYGELNIIDEPTYMDGMVNVFPDKEFHYDVFAQQLVVNTKDGRSFSVDFERLVKYDFDLNQISISGNMIGEYNDVSSAIQNNIHLLVLVMTIILAIYVFSGLRKKNESHMFGSMPVSRKQIIMSIYVFIQSALLCITSAAGLMALIQSTHTSESQTQMILALINGYIFNVMISTLFMLILSMVIIPLFAVIVFVGGYVAAEVLGTIISTSVFAMFGVTVPEFRMIITNMVVLMENLYAKLSADMTYAKYLQWSGICIAACLALTIAMCMLMINIFRKNDLSRNLAVLYFEISNKTIYFKNIVLGIALFMITGTTILYIDNGNISMKSIGEVLSHHSFADEYSELYSMSMPYMVERHILLGIGLILMGAGVGFMYSKYRISKREGKKYA